MDSLADSLERARREYDEAVDRGDTETAELIARAIDVLERAEAGALIPAQRRAPES